MLPYAAYLRVYESLAAFAEPDRSRWAEYTLSAHRPERVSTLEAEHDEAIRRLIAVPPIIAPAHESDCAYVRHVDGVSYVCPWQTRLRAWLALGRLRATLPPALADTFVPRQLADHAAADFARWHSQGPSIRTHILTATWHVPLAWFVPFGPPERWLVLGTGGSDGRPATAAATRALVYVTTMGQARRRVARALAAVRGGLSRGVRTYGEDAPPQGSAAGGDLGGEGRPLGTAPPGAIPRRAGGRHAARRRHDDAVSMGEAGPGPDGGPRHAAGPPHADSDPAPSPLVATPLPAAVTEIEEVGRWLEEFHPRSLVELDYGGLVHLMNDEALRADQSVAEVAVAVSGLETGELELAVAMYQRLRTRWRAIRDAELAN